MKQLSTFFVLAYLISWIIWLPLYGPVFGITALPELPYHHGLGGLGPFIASFITTWIYEKKAGVIKLLKKCLQITPLLYLSLAFLSPFIISFIATATKSIVEGTSIDLTGILSNPEFPHFNFLTLFFYNLIYFGFGEEIGWRGFALPRFQDRFNALASSVILAFFWAVWHWPLFFYRPGYTSMDMAGIAGWILSLVTGSVLLTWFYNSARGSILICAVFHSTVDIAFTSDLADKGIVNYMGFLITVWGILTILIFKPRNLAFKERIRISGP